MIIFTNINNRPIRRLLRRPAIFRVECTKVRTRFLTHSPSRLRYRSSTRVTAVRLALLCANKHKQHLHVQPGETFILLFTADVGRYCRSKAYLHGIGALLLPWLTVLYIHGSTAKTSSNRARGRRV